jgi:hypothetical protein
MVVARGPPAAGHSHPNDGGNVLRLSMTGPLVAVALVGALGATPVAAQLTPIEEIHRYEFTPFAGYQFGGGWETDASGSVPAGDLNLEDAFTWGAILGFVAHPGSVVELTYLREDTDVNFDRAAGGQTALGGFAVNYIQIGGRQEFGTGGRVSPFLDISLGIGIFDPKAEGIGSDTRFSWSVGGGFRVPMGESGRTSIRVDTRLWITPFPSGDYAVWCDFYGCFTAEGTTWVTQGTVSGGLAFAF